MADRVEAELETPEALSIAKNDVLNSKMDEERQRCPDIQQYIVYHGMYYAVYTTLVSRLPSDNIEHTVFSLNQANSYRKKAGLGNSKNETYRYTT